jgi:hypothetical protein
MRDDMNIKPDVEDALSALREDYEQTATPIENQPEPKRGKEMRGWRFPKAVSYALGGVAAMMLVVAIFLFNAQNQPAGAVSNVDVAGAVIETGIDPETGEMVPTPPLMAEPPLPEEAVLEPPEPTPWPTPPIAEEVP